MNRPLKFRVWDKAEREFADIHEYDSKNWFDRFSSGKSAIPETLTLQQFVGIVDKNGMEIYEGDIVEFSYETYQGEIEKSVGEVYFEDGIFYFGRKEKFATNDCNFLESSLEIIGNNFENPELID